MKKYLILLLCSYALPILLDAQNEKTTQYADIYQDEKKGCIDGNGKIIIPMEYDFVYGFSEGMAVVNTGGEYDDNYDLVGGLCGYYDQNGDLVIPLQYEDAGNFSEGLAMVKKNGKWGFINKLNQNIIPFQYEDANSFSDGLAVVKVKEKYGAIDKMGRLVIPAIYDELDSFNEGLASVYHFQKMVVDEEYGSTYKQGKYGLLDKSNKLVADTIYDYVGFFDNGMAKVRNKDKTGMLNNKGDIIIPIEFEEISTFSEGLAVVGKYMDEDDLSDYRYGYINLKGEVVIDFKYTYAYDFKKGIAIVEKDYSDASYNLIDPSGNYLLDKNYHEINEVNQDSVYILYTDEFSHGGYKLGTGQLTPSGYDDLNFLGDGFFYVEESDTGEGAIISKGKIAAVKSYFINIQAGIGDHFIAQVITDNEYNLITKTGIINSKGQWIVEPKYDSISGFASFE